MEEKEKELKQEVLAYIDNEDDAKKLTELFEYSGLKDSKYEFDEISALYKIYVNQKDYELANNIYHDLLKDEILENDEDEEKEEKDFDSLDELNSQRAFREPTLYNSKEEKYKDNLSSAFTFMVCGLIGLVVLLINDLGIIKLISKDSSSFIVMNVVLALVFIVFLGIGIWSLIYSKKLKLEAKKENEAIEKITEFLEDNLNKDNIDKKIKDDLPDEILYFSRVDLVESATKAKFKTYDKGLIATVSEKYIEKLYA